MNSTLERAVARVTLERQHKALLRRFAECEKAVRRMPAGATYFVPPSVPEVSAMTKLKDKGMVCQHGRFRFEPCGRCPRSAEEARAELLRIQRMYE
jgi:hypothetical protein